MVKHSKDKEKRFFFFRQKHQNASSCLFSQVFAFVTKPKQKLGVPFPQLCFFLCVIGWQLPLSGTKKKVGCA